MKLYLASTAVLFLVVESTANPSGPSALQNILQNTDNSPLYGYPTDLTRDIIPLPVHSHNDYWRDVPFYSGLSAGCISTEADIWLYGDTLYVGHDQSSLTESRTLESLYINPILDVLKRQNPESQFVTNPTTNGVFDTNPAQTLYLFIDVKTSGPETWPHVVKALEPLRAAGYLTSVKNNDTITHGPVTVIGTGNTPLELVGPVENRDYFYDGPLASLGEPEFSDITDLISPIASTSFASTVGKLEASDDGEVLNKKQLKAIREQIEAAKKKGIGARYWETPGWPVRTRDQVWRTLLREGVALLNADDLEAPSKFF